MLWIAILTLTFPERDDSNMHNYPFHFVLSVSGAKHAGPDQLPLLKRSNT